MITSRRTRWAGHVHTWGEKRCVKSFGKETLKEIDRLECLGIDWRRDYNGPYRNRNGVNGLD
jgi:hypothetical protein